MSMLKVGRCLSRLTQHASLPALGSQACRTLVEPVQENACFAVCMSQSLPSRPFFSALGAQQQAGAPMMESQRDAEEEEQRREDLRQHRGTPQDTAQVQYSGEPKGAEGQPQIDTQNYQPGTRHVGLDVPAGHINSDLSSHSCSLVLGRRRDLTLRGDVELSRGSHTATLTQLLKNKVAILVGLPDMGPVCSEKHVPQFLEKLDEIVDCGIDRVYCISHASTGELGDWSKSVGIEDKPKVEAWADDSGGFIRMLGLETVGVGGGSSHRWAAITQDGILLKLRVEDNPTQVEETSADAMLGCWRYFKELESVK